MDDHTTEQDKHLFTYVYSRETVIREKKKNRLE